MCRGLSPDIAATSRVRSRGFISFRTGSARMKSLGDACVIASAVFSWAAGACAPDSRRFRHHSFGGSQDNGIDRSGRVAGTGRNSRFFSFAQVIHLTANDSFFREGQHFPSSGVSMRQQKEQFRHAGPVDPCRAGAFRPSSDSAPWGAASVQLSSRMPASRRALAPLSAASTVSCSRSSSRRAPARVSIPGARAMVS